MSQCARVFERWARALEENEMNRRIAIVVLIAAFVVAAAAQEAGIQVENGVLAAAVEDREPVGVAESFGADVGRVCYHTILVGDFGATTIEHVWERAGEEAARVSLDVQGPRWRTWSCKKIPAEWAGAWRVLAVDASGTELQALSFTVGE